MIAKRSPPSSCPARRTRSHMFLSSGGYQVATCPLCQLSCHKECILEYVPIEMHEAMMRRALGDVPAGTPIVPVDIGKMLCCLCAGFVECEMLSEEPDEIDRSEPSYDSDE